MAPSATAPRTISLDAACAALCYSCRTHGAPELVEGAYLHTAGGGRLLCRAAELYVLANAPALEGANGVLDRDIADAYKLALRTPELGVFDGQDFATFAEFDALCRAGVFIAERYTGVEEEPLSGFAVVTTQDPACPDAVVLVWIAVDPFWRRCGIGRRLVEQVVKSAPDKSKLVLWADDNEKPSDFFKVCGHGEGKRAVWMEMDL